MKSCMRPALVVLFLGCVAAGARAQSVQEVKPPPPDPPDATSNVEIYGFVMLDLGHDFKQIDPRWIDTMRVTQLPKVENQFGRDHTTFASVRQTRVGVRSSAPTDMGKLSTLFEFNMMGSGVDAGQTTLRLRHAWGELGAFGAGQTWSVFTDLDAAPKAVEPLAPTGLPFFRNVQLRWTPIRGVHTFMVAAEKPGGSADDGIYAERIELKNVQARFRMPDFTAAYKFTQSWGHVRAAGVVRHLNWDDTLEDQYNLSGGATGWGVSVTGNLKPTPRDLIRLAFTTGEGIQNYMADAPVDIGIVNNFSNPITPILGKPIPLVAFSGFIEHAWKEHFSSTVGYSRQDNDNREAQAPNAFRVGEYALGDLQYVKSANFAAIGELQWGRRQNFSDGFQSDDFIAHFVIRYNFSWRLGG